MVIYLGRAFPPSSSGLPGFIGRDHPNPAWPCSGWGLPSHRIAPMLVSSCLTFPPLPFHRRFEVSMALSRDRSLWVLPSIPSRGVRTFLRRTTCDHPLLSAIYVNLSPIFISLPFIAARNDTFFREGNWICDTTTIPSTAAMCPPSLST